jgi:hypothetical protein
MEIEPPRAFVDTLRRFHQDIEKTCPTLELLAEFAVRGLRGEDREAVARFLDEVLSGRYSGGELTALLRRSPADIYLSDAKQVAELLRLMREMLEQP